MSRQEDMATVSPPSRNTLHRRGRDCQIKYDRTRIPSGYTEDDIRTYYYDRPRSIGLRWSVCVWTEGRVCRFKDDPLHRHDQRRDTGPGHRRPKALPRR